MKKMLVSLGLIAAYATFLGLGCESLLNLLSLSMAISPDGSFVAHPLDLLPCAVAGILALAALAVTVALHVRASERFELSRRLLWAQVIAAAVASIPMIKLWEMLFDLLWITL